MLEDTYWAIADAELDIQNPATDRKLRLLEDYCDLRDGLKILDIGCGKAWLIRGWASRFAVTCVGLDSNRHFIDTAVAHPPSRGRIDYVLGPAAAYNPEPASFDIVMCLAASSALGGMVETLDWMVAATRPGGSVVLGDMTLRHRPLSPQGHVLPHDAADTIAIIERHGAEVSATISASEADYERYASHHRHATLAWARQNPQNLDAAAVLARSREDWTYYLQWIRPHLGWTIFVGRKQGN